jgi:C-terminal processing protease CtpA/Prc
MNKISKALATFSVSTILFACSEWTQTPDDEIELHYNYLMLKAYSYKRDSLKDFSEYEGMEVDDMYKSLNDTLKKGRYTFYEPPSKADEVIDRIENTERYYSFGFERDVENDTLIVSAVYPISPAAEAGLQKHDKLLMANSTSITNENAELYLKNDDPFEKSTVLKVMRNQNIIDLPAMQKRDVKVPTVFLDSLANIPYITITEFTVSTNNPNGTYAEFMKYLNEIKGANAAIINLRSNGGGNTWHCTAMASELAQNNNEMLYDVAYTYDKKRGYVIDTTHYFAKDFLENRKGEGANIKKWIILINKGSASCSERFTAAVKNIHPETIIIGELSYGKGIGQMYTKTYLGGLAYITSKQTFYGNGETYHRNGITPDINATSDEEIYEAIAAQVSTSSLAAKRLSISSKQGTLPPEYKTREILLGAHERK